MNIAFFETMPGERELLEPHVPPGHTITFFDEKLTEETVAKAAGAEIVSVFVNSEVRQPLIDKLPNLKLITTRSVGFDHIDVEYAKSKGIRAVNVTTYAAHPVAEFAFALLLCVTRRICEGCEHMRQGTDHDIRTLKGFNLFGKTLGVVGTGRIGRKVVAIAKGFGMQVIASDTKPDEVFANEQQFRYIPLETLASTADIITLHAPYLQATHHLFDTAMFARMKKGVVLINTARGELVDTRALVAALQNGTVWGAGLDVLEKDEEALNRTLIDMPNTVVTPHVAFETVEALEEIERATAQAITNFVAGTEQQYL